MPLVGMGTVGEKSPAPMYRRVDVALGRGFRKASVGYGRKPVPIPEAAVSSYFCGNLAASCRLAIYQGRKWCGWHF